MRTTSPARAGWWFGLLGVTSFSLTLPATRTAVTAFDPVTVTLGRALVAALLAGLLLWITRQRVPPRSQWIGLAVVAAGVVLGFPLLSAWAMRLVPASHGAVVLGLLPLATAGVSVIRAGERPSVWFWLTSVAGSTVVVGYALSTGAGRLHLADLALLGAVLAAAVGYAEGGRLARELGAWQVISWALVLAAPFLAVPMVVAVWASGPSGPLSAWIAFGYLAVVSQFLGFISWYRGLALGGVAQVSQLQLLQPFLTTVASGLIWGERITPAGIGAALVVAATVALGRKATVAGPGTS